MIGLVDKYLRALQKNSGSGRMYLIRQRDGMPLAKGYFRVQLERMGDVFRKLGTECYVVRNSIGNALHQGETEARADYLKREGEFVKSKKVK